MATRGGREGRGCQPPASGARPFTWRGRVQRRHPFRTALVLGAGCDIAHRVSGDRGDHRVDDAADMPRVVDVRVVEHHVPATPRGARRIGLALREDVDEPRPVALGEFALDGEAGPAEHLLPHRGSVDGVLHCPVGDHESARLNALPDPSQIHFLDRSRPPD